MSWALVLLAIAAVETPRVALDLSGLDADTYRELNALALEKQIVLRLVQEGFAVVAAKSEPDLRLRIEKTERGLIVSCARGEVREERAVSIESGELAELHLELVHKAIELARSLAASIPAPAAVETSTKSAEDRDTPPPIDPPQGRRSRALEVFARGGAIVRSGGTDPSLSVLFRLELFDGWAAYVDGGLIGSSERDVRVREWNVLAGAGRSFSAGDTFSIDVLALGGISVHDFQVDVPGATNTSGSPVDFLASFPIRFTAESGRFGVSTWFAPGFLHRKRTHLFAGDSIWSRGPYRLEVGLGASFSWD